MIAPNGKVVYKRSENVALREGETFGQLLLENVKIPINNNEGTYRISADIKANGQQVRAHGYDEVIAVNWETNDLAGNGALLWE